MTSTNGKQNGHVRLWLGSGEPKWWWERGWFDRFTLPLWGLALLWAGVIAWFLYLAHKGGLL